MNDGTGANTAGSAEKSVFFKGSAARQKETEGLYQKDFEHDACGIGFVASIKGEPSRLIVTRALEALERMEHRGAESADNKTGDGSGVLVQTPHSFYKKLIPGLPACGEYGCGLLFLPREDALAEKCAAWVEKSAKKRGLSVCAWRNPPVNSEAAGEIARGAEPVIRQVFLKPDGEIKNLELSLYFLRKDFEKYARDVLKNKDAYFPSLSSRTIVYKGMLTASQLREYYGDLNDADFKSAAALVHSRFSTNTFPAWNLAQPFRFLAHNGEINTIKGNRFWAAAREALYECEAFGGDVSSLLPVIEPEKSDSASFDNMLEFLAASGRSLPHALMMMIPEAWDEKKNISRELKDFYAYHDHFMESWDGPASIVFFDGRYVGGTLDRNGLRPSRYTVTKNGLIVMGSETGVQDFKPEEIEYKGRLMPGKLLLVDLQEGRIIPDAEVKRTVSQKQPYSQWLCKNSRVLPQDEIKASASAGAGRYKTELFKSDSPLLFMQRTAGYSREDRDKLLFPMALTGVEPANSMGTDTPLAVFSDVPQRPFAYFKQLFAQVTNPPIDSIREDLVMSLTAYAGAQTNILKEGPENCRRIQVKQPLLLPQELNDLEKIALEMGFNPLVLDAVFMNDEADGKPASLEAAIDGLVDEAVLAVKNGCGVLILSDSAALDPLSKKIPVPSLLAAGAVHHALIKAGARMKTSIIIETAEAREIMHFALLFGYGADLVCPYGAFASIAEICRNQRRETTPLEGKVLPDYAHSVKNYLKGMQKALLKVMSKMGTSALRSYCGAQIFEALGLGDGVINKCFCGALSRIGGAGFKDLEKEARVLYRRAVEAWEAENESPGDKLLFRVGQYSWRKGGEAHAWNPETIHLLQWAVKSADYGKFKQFTAASDAINKSPHVIRGLLEFNNDSASPVPLQEVEGVDEIMRRFTTGAMSFGSISKEAHETIARALNSIHGRSNSGEGGEESERFFPAPDGTSARSAIKQVASARFGVTSEYLANCIELQIKMAQGAKPGEGGQLPGHKVDQAIARVRHSTPGVTLISPPPHHDIYSIEDLAQLIFDLKNANREARISVKLVSEAGVGTVAAGVAKAHADNILISGYDGGTGASPQSSIRHAGIPWELGLSETHQTLMANGLRSRVRLQTDGQLKSGRDIVIAGMLGAEEFGFGTATLIVLGCVMMRKCHENTCPMGVATQDPRLRARFAGKSEHLITYFRFLASEVREIMAGLGIRKFNDLVGRTDLLRQIKSPKEKSSNVDLSRVLKKAAAPSFTGADKDAFCSQNQIHKIENVADRVLIEKCDCALKEKKPARLKMTVKNTDRAVGTMLSYEISKKYGGEGLPDDTIHVEWLGSAGQSFGAFLAPGVTFRLAGETNDYLGKGLSGGRIAVFPPANSSFLSNENIIAGNTVLYGATSGELYVAGIAGERFCVRNSGALAVTEGAGDHCAEYMTGGRLVVLGTVGRNFAAGMSGGIAYVLDRNGDFDIFLNRGMVETEKLEDADEEAFVLKMIQNHVKWTFSDYASRILDDWAEVKKLFVKVIPTEYKKVLQASQRAGK
ncbi:MAG: glutamate synthase large subunit [Spirochaetaceae bacterium]|jgi:glutamate synthase (NADPH/NADH) large chain|nr:glutamate synthase large subunit [Spirochaetaceae bacterium]